MKIVSFNQYLYFLFDYGILFSNGDDLNGNENVVVNELELVVNDTVAFLLLMIDNSNSIMQNVALLNISGNTHYT